MNASRRLRFAALALLSCALPAFPARGPQEPVAERRAAILATAQRFATVRWRAEERHALHGEDGDGVRVDTPDVQLDP